MKVFFREPMVRFLLSGLALYLTWLTLYEWVIHPWGRMDQAVVNNTIFVSIKILNGLGFGAAAAGSRVMGISGTPGLFIGDSCDGISLFALYSIFIICFPGKPASKLVFIPAGILAIHGMNIARVLALAIIETHSYEWTLFNHTYTFTILMYAFILGMWLLWINRFSGMQRKSA